MADFNNEERIKELVRTACPSAAPSSEFRAQLLQNLSSGAYGTDQQRWRQPKFWIPLTAGIISAFIGYGAWLGQTMSAMVSP
jgi:hypothetical protein